jgi:hypothetical protein
MPAAGSGWLVIRPRPLLNVCLGSTASGLSPVRWHCSVVLSAQPNVRIMASR